MRTRSSSGGILPAPPPGSSTRRPITRRCHGSALIRCPSYRHRNRHGAAQPRWRFLSWRGYDRAAVTPPPDSSAAGRPHRFTAIVGIGISLLFALVILTQGAAALVSARVRAMKRLAIVFATLIPLPALAHGGSHDVASPFSLEAWVAVPLLFSGILYVVGVLRLWTRLGLGRGVQIWQALCFACGWILLAIALVSPMHQLGERIFAVHMLEHEILMTLAAPLLVLARPVGGILWAFPADWRRRIGVSADIGILRDLALSNRPRRRDAGARHRNLDLACSPALQRGPGQSSDAWLSACLLLRLRAPLLVGAVARAYEDTGLWCSGVLPLRHRAAFRLPRNSPFDSKRADLPRSIGRRGRMGPVAARGSTDGGPHHVGACRHRLCGRNTCDARNLDCAIECHVLTGRAPCRYVSLDL